MSSVIKSPIRSEYGFKSTDFEVDTDGNISARSITLLEEEVETDVPADFIVIDENDAFVIDGTTGNPDLVLTRNSTKTFDLDLDELNFNIFEEDLTTLYNDGVRHDDGTAGSNAQNKTSGRLAFSVPLSAPDILYYSTQDGSVFGKINVQDPEGVFSSVTINSDTESTDTSTGSLVTAGGIAVAKSISVGNSVRTGSVVGTDDLTIKSNGAIIVRKTDDSLLGEITNTGSSIPVLNTTVDNTIIGQTTPATAFFQNASSENNPVNSNDLTNKNYVDNQDIAFSIVFGL